MLAQFLHFVDNAAFWLLVFALYPALCLIPLFLLPGLFLLALSKG